MKEFEVLAIFRLWSTACFIYLFIIIIIMPFLFSDLANASPVLVSYHELAGK